MAEGRKKGRKEGRKREVSDGSLPHAGVEAQWGGKWAGEDG